MAGINTMPTRAWAVERRAPRRQCGALTYTYDTFGRIHIADATGKTTILSPDEQGRPTRLKDAAGRELAQQYDAASNLAALDRSAGQPYTFDYDRQGNVIGAENPAGPADQAGL